MMTVLAVRNLRAGTTLYDEANGRYVVLQTNYSNLQDGFVVDEMELGEDDELHAVRSYLMASYDVRKMRVL